MDKKKRKKPGWALFIDRMRREDRYHLYKEKYEDFLSQGENQKQASYKACVMIGYLGPEQEREIQSDWLAAEEARAGRASEIIKVKEEKDSSDKDAKSARAKKYKEMKPVLLQREQLDLMDELGEYDINESALPIDIAWVFHNLHKCKGELDEWLVGPHNAPTPGAWSMLVWAAGNQTKFMELVIREEMKVNSSKDDDKTIKATNHTIAQIEEMLANI
jgi:hypothetical protein|tara:strand:+ start:522 stop:1175 length:654 start_codon:yes stop_codon:yes gene_type:complete